MSYRGKGSRKAADENEGLLVFGYSSRVYPNDSRSQLIASDGHLQAWTVDNSVVIDSGLEKIGRFDCRLLLSVPVSEERRGSLSKEEEKEEAACEEERWRDLHEAELDALKREEVSNGDSREKKAEVEFNYDQPSTANAESESDSEDEPFVPPPNIKLPLGLETPDNQKQNHVIERTALFVVKQGPQMEIVIKAKQRNNLEQFGFLHFDNILNPYYKYIMKLIREGKYTPNLDAHKKKKNVEKENIAKGEDRPKNALAALAQLASDSDSDSDCELHPSLLAASRKGGSPDRVGGGDPSFHGPLRRPTTPPPSITRTDYRIETANDSYSALFKNLAVLRNEKEKAKEEDTKPAIVEEKRETSEVQRNEVDVRNGNEEEWNDLTLWYETFYGMKPPFALSSLVYQPPPPDMEKVVASYAKYVAENGAEAEFALKGRVELQLNFLNTSSPHYLFYLMILRRCHWTVQSQMAARQEVVGPQLNRKQRRSRLQDAPRVESVEGPSTIDPLSLITAQPSMTRSTSSPIVHTVEGPMEELGPSLPHSPAPAKSSLTGITLVACPVPPTVRSKNEIMTERQIKARLFMEKILKDKQKKKDDPNEEEEEKVVGGETEIVCMEDGEIEEDKEEEKNVREGERDRKRRRRSASRHKDSTITTNILDNIIKQKMDQLLKETVPGSLAVEKKNEELKEKREEEENERKKSEKKEKRREGERKSRRERHDREERRKKKKRKKSRSRSRSKSSESQDDRRRRRSRSSHLPSRYRR